MTRCGSRWSRTTSGSTTASRHADWTGAEFTAESWSHVSVYRIPRASTDADVGGHR
jgi:hypothetical protein